MIDPCHLEFGITASISVVQKLKQCECYKNVTCYLSQTCRLSLVPSLYFLCCLLPTISNYVITCTCTETHSNLFLLYPFLCQWPQHFTWCHCSGQLFFSRYTFRCRAGCSHSMFPLFISLYLFHHPPLRVSFISFCFPFSCIHITITFPSVLRVLCCTSLPMHQMVLCSPPVPLLHHTHLPFFLQKWQHLFLI